MHQSRLDIHNHILINFASTPAYIESVKQISVSANQNRPMNIYHLTIRQESPLKDFKPIITTRLLNHLPHKRQTSPFIHALIKNVTTPLYRRIRRDIPGQPTRGRRRHFDSHQSREHSSCTLARTQRSRASTLPPARPNTTVTRSRPSSGETAKFTDQPTHSPEAPVRFIGRNSHDPRHNALRSVVSISISISGTWHDGPENSVFRSRRVKAVRMRR